MRRPPRALVLAAALGLLAALAVLAIRYRVETAYRTVEIMLDGPDWEALALREGRDPAAVLAEAARRGATSVALYEWTLERLAERGEIIYRTAEDLRVEGRLGIAGGLFAAAKSAPQTSGSAVYVAGPPPTLDFLETAFTGLLGTDRVQRRGDLLEVRGLRKDLEQLALGFRAGELEALRHLGLQPALRLRNVPGLTADGLAAKGAHLAALGRGHPVVFELLEVLGYQRLIRESAATLQAAGARYGRIETFNVRRKQRGEDQMAGEMRPEIIRLFSLTPEELLVLSPEEARDKFVRGARERNIRLLYVRPFAPTAGVVGTASNLQFVADLTAALRRFGLQPGRAAPLPEVAVPGGLRWVTALGALAAMSLVLLMLGAAIGAPVPVKLVWIFVAAALGITAILVAAGPATLWLKVLALGTASAVPAAAVAAALPGRPGGPPVLHGLRTLWLASAASVAAGALVAALLTRWEFMMAADVFLGVKIAQVLPVIVIVLLLWRHDRPPRSWRETARELWAWSGHPLLLRYAIVAVVAAVAGVILLARSGNFGLPLPAVEAWLRNLMEELLVARPRTKEWLIGHPALVLAGAAAAAGWRRWVLLLAAVGVIGQAGIVNSFAHIHTPLVYTAWRTANALVLGTVLGAAAALVAGVLLRRWGSAPGAGPARRAG